MAELISSLPCPSEAVDGILRQGVGRWAPVTLHPPQNPLFLEPGLTLVHGDGAAPDVILIEASAGAGKTLLSNHLAARTGNPLIDLSRELEVGANYFRGGIGRAFQSHAWEVERWLYSGNLSLIIDALDEALVASPEQNFTACIRDLAELLEVEEESRGIRAVLLGRPDSIETARKVLVGAGVRCQVLRISLFEEDKRRDLILKLAHRKFPRLNVKQFRQIVDEFLDLLTSALGSDESERGSFLGYAPVIDAIASMAGSENLYAKLAALKANDDRREAWRLLSRIPEWLLARECEKIVAAARDSDKHLVRELYSPEMQLQYLYLESLSAIEIQKSISNETQRERLLALITAQLAIHPFLKERSDELAIFARFSSNVFRDYTVARGIASGDLDALISIMDNYDRHLLPVSPVMVRLLFSLADYNAREPIHVDPAMIGVLCESGSMEIGDETSLRTISLTGSEVGSSPGVLQFHFMENGEPLGVAECTLERNHVLRLERALGNCFLDLPGISIEAGGGPSFAFMPPVSITCETFLFATRSVSVRGRAKPKVRLNARRVTGSFKEVGISLDDLEIMTNNTHFPWNKYVTGPFSGMATSVERMDAASGFRRLFWNSRRLGIRYSGHEMPSRMRVVMTRYFESFADYLVVNGFLAALPAHFPWVPDSSHFLMLTDKGQRLFPVCIAMDFRDDTYAAFIDEYITWRHGAASHPS